MKPPSIWTFLLLMLRRPWDIPLLIRIAKAYNEAQAKLKLIDENFKNKLRGYGWTENQISEVMEVLAAGGEFEPDHFERWHK